MHSSFSFLDKNQKLHLTSSSWLFWQLEVPYRIFFLCYEIYRGFSYATCTEKETQLFQHWSLYQTTYFNWSTKSLYEYPQLHLHVEVPLEGMGNCAESIWPASHTLLNPDSWIEKKYGYIKQTKFLQHDMLVQQKPFTIGVLPFDSKLYVLNYDKYIVIQKDKNY